MGPASRGGRAQLLSSSCSPAAAGPGGRWAPHVKPQPEGHRGAGHRGTHRAAIGTDTGTTWHRRVCSASLGTVPGLTVPAGLPASPAPSHMRPPLAVTAHASGHGLTWPGLPPAPRGASLLSLRGLLSPTSLGAQGLAWAQPPPSCAGRLLTALSGLSPLRSHSEEPETDSGQGLDVGGARRPLGCRSDLREPVPSGQPCPPGPPRKQHVEWNRLEARVLPGVALAP